MIQINEKLRIVKLDDYNLAIEELKEVNSKKNGTMTKWCRNGYYGSLKMALCGVLEKELFDSVEEELALKDVINKIEEAKKQILKLKC